MEVLVAVLSSLSLSLSLCLAAKSSSQAQQISQGGRVPNATPADSLRQCDTQNKKGRVLLPLAAPHSQFIMAHAPPPLPQEIIEIIFSSLSQSTLRCCVRLVCKEWNLICLKYALWRAGVWASNLDGKRISRLLKQSRRLDSLAIWVQCDPGLTDHRKLELQTTLSDKAMYSTWNLFCHGLLDQLSQFNLQRSGSGLINLSSGRTTLTARRALLNRHPLGNLKELSLHGYGIEHERYLQPLLPALCHLQRLKLELWDRQTVKLTRLLRACPVLEDLEVFGRESQGLRIWVVEDDDKVGSLLDRHHLKRLYLRQVSIRQKSLERLAMILCDLVSFRVVDFNRPWASDPNDFFCEPIKYDVVRRLISTHMFPPERRQAIEAFQIDIEGNPYRFADYWFPYSRSYFHSVIFPGIKTCQWPSHMLRDRWYIRETCDHITMEITRMETDAPEGHVPLIPGILNCLRNDRVLKHLLASECAVHVLDLVEVFQHPTFQEAIRVQTRAKVVHSTGLVQAVAPPIETQKEGGNVGRQTRKKRASTTPVAITPEVPVRVRAEALRLNHNEAWICEGLLTLKLGLVARHKFIPKSPAEFAALANGPRLLTFNEELARAYAYIVACCPNLRTVEFFHPIMEFGQQSTPSTDQSQEDMDLFHPLKQLASLHDLESLTLRLTTIEGHIDHSDFEWMMTTDGSSSNSCWPRLESFQIRYKNSKEEDFRYWMALMRELRPGLDVRAKQDLLVPIYSGR